MRKQNHDEHREINVPRSDGAHQSLHKLSNSDILKNVNLSMLLQKQHLKSHAESTHDEHHDSIKVTRSDGIKQDLLSVIKAQTSVDFGDQDNATSSPGRSRPPPLPEPVKPEGKRSLSMASIFGTRSVTVDRPSLGTKQSTVAVLSSVPESAFHPATVRIVHMSNSYGFLHRTSSQTLLPRGDILVHSGDFTEGGTDEEFAAFDAWLKAVRHLYHYRVVVLGMSDVRRYGADWDIMRALLPHATHVLCHEEATIMGIRFYGCPWNWGHDFDYSVRPVAPANTSGRFEEIPRGVHVLVTHGAPFGVLDGSGFDKTRVHHGSRELAEAVGRAQTQLHLHGHVCSGRGVSLPFANHPLTVNSCMCLKDHLALYATAHVVEACKVMSKGEGSTWTFAVGPLES